MKLHEMLVRVMEDPLAAEYGPIGGYLVSDPDLRGKLNEWLHLSMDMPHSTLLFGAMGWVVDAIRLCGLPDDLDALDIVLDSQGGWHD